MKERKSRWHRVRRSLGAFVVLAVLGLVAAVLLWNPYPGDERVYDRGANGLWIGHKWYSGRAVRSGDPVTEQQVDALAEVLRRRGIGYAYVHVGPILSDGTLEDRPGPLLSRLIDSAPRTRFLAWMGALLGKIDLEDASWREQVLATIAELRAAGFHGVHFNLEPLRDGQPGYLDLLDAVRRRFGKQMMISQATPRSGPFGLVFGPLRGKFWSESYYRRTMARSDQTVLMAYDTFLPSPMTYAAFVAHETRLLTDWACDEPAHRVLIGVPSYEDSPRSSDPQVESLHTAVLGVRAGLENASGRAPDCFEGVAIYAHWVTDEEEWDAYERYWRRGALP